MVKKRTQKANRRPLDAVVRLLDWRQLRRSDVLRNGDRSIYAGGEFGALIHESEIGMTVAASGYFGAARKKSNAELSGANNPKDSQ